MTRVYVAGTRVELRRLDTHGVLPDGPAFAVTSALRAAYAEVATDDEEELEYVAMRVAARASLTRLNRSDPLDRRRIVVAADAEVRGPRKPPDGAIHPARVELLGSVPMADVVSVHVDTDDVRDLVDAAVRALPDVAAGDEAAAAVVDALDAENLAWYATQELGDLT